MEITRRSLLNMTAAAGAMPLVAGCAGSRLPKGPAFADAVDIHAHCFNAADLPTREFISQSVLGRTQGTGSGFIDQTAAFGEVLGTIAREVAPSAEAEWKVMRGISTLSEAETEGRLLTEPLEDRLNRAVARALHVILRTEDRFDQTYAWVDPLIKGKGFRRTAEFFKPAGYPHRGSRKAKRIFLDELTGKLLNDRGLLKNHGPWARGVVRSRMDIMAEIARLYGGSRVGLFVPLQIDFTKWLGDELPEASSLDRQIDVMQVLQDLWSGAEKGPLFHGFVAFDPARDMADRGASLARVQRAVQERGFLGVKLYPPMGFTPWGNQDGRENYHQSVFDAARDGGVSPDRIGSALNASLRRLYEWADREGVPILAHANSSYSSNGNKGYRARAHPAGWDPVFDRYDNLRVCLAHFDDFNNANRDECLVETEERDGFRFALSRKKTRRCDEPWELTTINLMKRYPFQAFADVSYHHLALLEKGKHAWERTIWPKREAFRQYWRRFVESAPHGANLVFGTDWFLSGQEAGHAGMVEAVDRFMIGFKMREAARRRVFRQNALRFLGLVPGAKGPAGASYRRLRGYYDTHERLNPVRLDQFLGASV